MLWLGQSAERKQMEGPAAFPLERMLAIFHALLAVHDNDEAARQATTADLYSEVPPLLTTHQCHALSPHTLVAVQVTSLITLKLLTRVSHPSELSMVRLRCNVTRSTIDAVALSLGLKVNKYLYDPTV